MCTYVLVWWRGSIWPLFRIVWKYILDAMSHPSIQMISRGVIFALFRIQRKCVQMSLFDDVDQSMAFIFLLSLCHCHTLSLFQVIYFVAKWLPHALSELDSIVCTCYLRIFSFLLCLFLLYRPAQLKSHRSVSTDILLVNIVIIVTQSGYIISYFVVSYRVVVLC